MCVYERMDLLIRSEWQSYQMMEIRGRTCASSSLKAGPVYADIPVHCDESL